MRVPNAALYAALAAALGVAALSASKIFGWPVEYGTVADWCAAGGSVFAAVAALYIATRDRRDRERERLAGDEAHAKLVFTGMTVNSASFDDEASRPSYSMFVINHSERPVLDVEVLACTMRSSPGSIARLPESVIDVVVAGGDSRTRGVKFFTEDGTQLPHPQAPLEESIFNDRRWPRHQDLDLLGWLGFTDVNGNRWARSSAGEVRRITKPADIERLTR